MPKQTIRKHHYVPQFILRRWATDGTLTGYYWDNRTNEVRVKQKGASYFCNEQSLYALKSGAPPPDELERRFLGHIDDRGAKVTLKLLDNETHSLTANERADFARLLLSLEARRPVNVKSLKSKGAQHFEQGLDTDPEILDAFQNEGIDQKPSDYYQRENGVNLEDVSLLILQKLIDNEEVGKPLINAHWRVYDIPSDCGSLVLSDRPLIRTGPYDHPNTIWALPLTPQAVFFAANSSAVIKNIDQQTPKRLRKCTNGSSATQVERYVFMADRSNMPLIEKRLRLMNNTTS